MCKLKIFVLTLFVLVAPIATSAHQSGCHRWHTCASDSGSYVCGDLPGHPCEDGSGSKTYTAPIYSAPIVPIAPIIIPPTPDPSPAPAPKIISTPAPIISAPVAPTIKVWTPTKQTKMLSCKINKSLPDVTCTPGAIMTLDLKIICFQSTSVRRNVSESTANKVYAEYGVKKPKNNVGKNQIYEVDHLIPLELGGANDIANLFPEPAKPLPGFREKDKLENYLHKQVCAGKIKLSEAQMEIATNWVKYYTLYNLK